MKGKNGITLIALIITIIVLMILAGISISFLVGDNGILNKAKDAKYEMSKEQLEEENKVNLISNIIDQKIGYGINDNVLNQQISQDSITINIIQNLDDSKKFSFINIEVEYSDEIKLIKLNNVILNVTLENGLYKVSGQVDINGIQTIFIKDINNNYIEKTFEVIDIINEEKMFEAVTLVGGNRNNYDSALSIANDKNIMTSIMDSQDGMKKIIESGCIMTIKQSIYYISDYYTKFLNSDFLTNSEKYKLGFPCYLYNIGDEETDITGGWILWSGYSHSFSKESQNLYAYTLGQPSHYGHIYIRTVKTVNLTKYRNFDYNLYLLENGSDHYEYMGFSNLLAIGSYYRYTPSNGINISSNINYSEYTKITKAIDSNNQNNLYYCFFGGYTGNGLTLTFKIKNIIIY